VGSVLPGAAASAAAGQFLIGFVDTALPCRAPASWPAEEEGRLFGQAADSVMMEVEVDMGEGGGRPVMAREDFSRYYALGPELEESMGVVEGLGEEEGEEEWRRRLEEGRMEMEKQREEWRRNLNSGELSDDSGVKDGEESEGEEENEEEEEERKEREKERHAWKAGSVPQDLVASVQGLRVVREEPKPWGEKDGDVRRVVRQQPRAIASVHGEVEEQDVTEYRRRQQVEAYTNLEDLLDVAWEEEDLAPPTKVDVVLRVGGELGQRYAPSALGLTARRRIVQQTTGTEGQQCGIACSSCSIM